MEKSVSFLEPDCYCPLARLYLFMEQTETILIRLLLSSGSP
jgi:hypothetical protein